MKKISVSVGILVVIVIGVAIYTSEDIVVEDKKQLTEVLTHVGSEEELIVNYTNALIYALNQFYLASVDDGTSVESLVDIMATLMKRNNYLQTGIDGLKEYIDHPDENINLSAKGSTVGAMQIFISNATLIEFIRSANFDDPKILQEFNYQLAKSSTENKEGFKLIVMSAPQVGSLFFRPTTSENPTGPIPYNLSKKNRLQIVNDINFYFEDVIREEELLNSKRKAGEREYNAILIAVKSLRDNLMYDTYEESDVHSED